MTAKTHVSTTEIVMDGYNVLSINAVFCRIRIVLHCDRERLGPLSAVSDPKKRMWFPACGRWLWIALSYVCGCPEWGFSCYPIPRKFPQCLICEGSIVK